MSSSNGETTRPTIFDALNAPPPTDRDSEASLLSALLVNSQACSQVGQICACEDFSDFWYQKTFEAISRVWGERGDCTVELVISRLRESADWDDGMYAMLGELSARNDGANCHARYYASRVRDASLRRRLGLALENAFSDCVDQSIDADAVVQKSLQRIYDLEEQRQTGDHLSTDNLVQTFLESIDTSEEGLVSTGLYPIDNLLAGGMRPGQLILLAARPSVGKTALALDISMHVAKEHGTVAFFSLEMIDTELAGRLMSKAAGVSFQKIRNRQLDPEDMQRINDSTEDISQLRLETFCGDQTMMSILQQARMLETTSKLSMIVVDYLQIVTPNAERGKTREREVSEIARFFKTMAIKLRVPVFACCQLNRELEKQPDRLPRLSDLRESGSLEQDADVVMFLHKKDRKDLIATLAIAKQRNGPLGTTTLDWDSKTCTYFEQQPEYVGDFDGFNNGE